MAHLDYSQLIPMLGFEQRPRGHMPGGWLGSPQETVFLDDKVVHGGRWALRLERSASSRRNGSLLTRSIPIGFRGRIIELRGYLRTEEVQSFGGLWMREENDGMALSYEDLQNRKIHGTSDWTQYSVKLRLDPEAKRLVFGVVLSGSGRLWADDLQLLVDGQPLWEAPSKLGGMKTVLDVDHQFDAGSGINIRSLSQVQVENLALLGKVWGFLKYYHTAITTGERQWDYELFRVLPQILSATDHDAADAILSRWVQSLGPVDQCSGCAPPKENDPQSAPDLKWIAQRSRLGKDLSTRLQQIRESYLPGNQFYVSKLTSVGNPVFQHELAYAHLKLPDSGFQLLSLFRFWNAVEYWSPYRDLLGKEWNGTLTEFIPRFAMAHDEDAYKREVFALLARFGDGHANLWDDLGVRPPLGKCELPIDVRFVQDVPVIRGFRSENTSDWKGLRVGDVITKLDGTSIKRLRKRWEPYYPASNESARLLELGRSLTRGPCGATKIAIRRDSQKLKVTLNRLPAEDLAPIPRWHDLPGPAFRLLSKDVAYLKLSSLRADQAAHYVQEAAGTKGMIIDSRDYPTDFMAYVLGALLVSRATPFVRITQGDTGNPGGFYWAKPVMLEPQEPHYAGKIVILVDETSMSSAEFHAMAFRAAPNALVVGSPTAGADGNTSALPLPAGLHTAISGVGVYYPDKRPTQRIGIVPDVQVRPTIEGIRERRDEVLEEGLRQILGPDVPAAEIAKIANPEGEAQEH